MRCWQRHIRPFFVHICIYIQEFKSLTTPVMNWPHCCTLATHGPAYTRFWPILVIKLQQPQFTQVLKCKLMQLGVHPASHMGGSWETMIAVTMWLNAYRHYILAADPWRIVAIVSSRPGLHWVKLPLSSWHQLPGASSIPTGNLNESDLYKGSEGRCNNSPLSSPFLRRWGK